MEEKKYAYQLDGFGIFVGMAERQISPLEEGVWLIPGGAVIEPEMPDLSEGQFARLVDGSWQIITTNEAHNVRNAYEIDSDGFLVKFVPKMNYFNGTDFVYPSGIQDNPVVPALEEGMCARLVGGVWETMTLAEMYAIKYPPAP